MSEPLKIKNRIPAETVQDVSQRLLFGCTLAQALAPHRLSQADWEAAMAIPEIKRLFDAATGDLIAELARGASIRAPLEVLERRLPSLWRKPDSSVKLEVSQPAKLTKEEVTAKFKEIYGSAGALEHKPKESLEWSDFAAPVPVKHNPPHKD